MRSMRLTGVRRILGKAKQKILGFFPPSVLLFTEILTHPVTIRVVYTQSIVWIEVTSRSNFSFYSLLLLRGVFIEYHDTEF